MKKSMVYFISVIAVICYMSNNISYAAETKEQKTLTKQGYRLVGAVTCDFNRDGKPEKAMLFKNTKKDIAVIAVVDNGKFIKLDSIEKYSKMNMSDISGCKVQDIAFGKTPKYSFGVTMFVGESAMANASYFKWNGVKYEIMSPPDFSE